MRGRSPKRKVVAVGVISSLILIGIGTYETNAVRENEIKDEQKSLSTLGISLSDEVARIVKKERKVSREASRLLASASHSSSEESHKELLKAFTSNTPVDNLFIYNLNGKAIYAVSQKTAVDPPQAPSLKQLGPGEIPVFGSQPPSSPSHITASRAFLDEQGHIKWLATSWINLSSFEEIVRTIAKTREYKVALLADDGRILMTFPKSESFDSNRLSQDAINPLGAGASGRPVHEEDDTNHPLEKVVIPIEGSSLVLHLSIDDDVILKDCLHNVWFIIGFVLIGIGIIWSLVAKVLQQLKRLDSINEAARDGETKISDILARLRDAVITTDHQGKILFSNSQAFKLLAASDKYDLFEQPVLPLLPASFRLEFDELLSRQVADDSPAITWEGSFSKLNGDTFDAELRAFLTFLEDEITAVITVRDVTDRKRYEERLCEGATLDLLTHLPTMAAFRDRLSGEIQIAEHDEPCLAVLALHLSMPDGELLPEDLAPLAADRLLSVTRDADSLGTEFGGKFYILAKDFSEPIDLALIANRIGKIFETPISHGRDMIVLTPKIGISIFPFDGKSDEALLSSAIAALSTLEFGDLFRFRNEFVSRQFSRFKDQVSRITAAISQGSLVLRFNPLVDLSSMELIGALVLPQIDLNNRLTSLDRLFPLLEEAHITAIAGNAVLRKVATELGGAADSGINRVLIPIQRDYFLSTEFLTLATSLRAQIASSVRIVFVVSEPPVGAMPQGVKLAIERLKAIGIETYLGEIGIGLASLTDISALGIAGVRVDRSIISTLDQGDQTFAFMTAIVASAEAIGIEVTVSGVDNGDLAEMLKNMGVKSATGQLFGKDLTLDELLTYMGRQPSLIQKLQSPIQNTYN